MTAGAAASSAPMLVYGDVDVVFVTTLKRIPADDPNSETAVGGGGGGVPQQHHHQHRQHHHLDSPGNGSTSKRTYAFIPPGKVNFSSAESSSSPSHSKVLNSHMTVTQFLAAVQELAVRLYSKVIEHKTGTVLECLPTQQRERAIRAALDVLMLKKIVPMANQLGLIPWELMVLDQCLTTIHSSDSVGACLVNHIHIFLSWFAHYSRAIPMTSSSSSMSQSSASTPPVHGMGNGEEKGWSSKSRDLLRSPAASYASSPLRYGATKSVNSPAQSSYSSPSHHHKATGGTYATPRGPPVAHTSLTTPTTPAFKGITYKEISKFYHDYGIVPYLLKEPQLYK
jgi:hypothetical protein